MPLLTSWITILQALVTSYGIPILLVAFYAASIVCILPSKKKHSFILYFVTGVFVLLAVPTFCVGTMVSMMGEMFGEKSYASPSVSWRPDGKALAIVDRGGQPRIYSDTLLEITRLPREGTIGSSVNWSPDSTELATTVGDNSVRIWDVNAWTVLSTLPSTFSVVWSHDGKKLATTGSDKTIKILNSVTFQPMKTLKGHSDQVYSMAWSPDDSKLASGSSDHTIRIWDIGTGETLKILRPSSRGFVYSVSWNLDGTKLASGDSDRALRIWDVDSGQIRTSIQFGHDPFWISVVAWSPDGKQIAAASDDILQTWDAVTLQLLFTFEGHTGGIDNISWSPDSTRIASVSTDNTIKIWSASTGETVATRNLED